jgi:hypothetical protein
MSMNTLNANLMTSPAPKPKPAANADAHANVLSPAKRSTRASNAQNMSSASSSSSVSLMSPKIALHLSPTAFDPLTPKHSASAGPTTKAGTSADAAVVANTPPHRIDTITSGMASFFGSMVPSPAPKKLAPAPARRSMR